MIKFSKFWKRYRTEVMHPDAHEIQVNECKAAFYGGALAIFEAILAAPDDVSEEQAADYLETLRKEIQATLEEMGRNAEKDQH